MSKNGLSTLLGQYMSDSDNEDDNSSNIVTQVDSLLDEISAKNGKSQQPITYWTQCIDPNTGHPYYWNIETKDVTWEKPLEYENYVKYMTAMSTKSPENCWIKGYSEDTKTPYYVNEYTRVVSWEKPAEYKEKSTKATAPKKPRQKKPKPAKKPRPKHLEHHSDDEKIELISTYACKSESSSDESHANESKKATEKKSKIKLVAAYSTDSDSDINDQNDEISIKTVIPIIPHDIPIDADKPASPQKTPSEPEQSESLSPGLNIKTNSFASIITGGKTDNIMDEELNKFKEELEKDLQQMEKDDASKLSEVKETSTSFDEKTFQRKRRIEIRPKSNTNDDVRLGLGYSNENSNANNEDIKSKHMYINFQKSHVEFIKDSPSEDVNCQLTVEKDGDVTMDKSLMCQNKAEIEDLCDVIGGKVKFLSVGKPEISAVQVINIQLETLLVAFRASHLDAEYFFKWLKSTSDDLATLEQNAAPEGWECKWDRENSQYCYKNLTTNEVQLEFPKVCNPENEKEEDAVIVEPETVTDAIKGEDEMDICTTPPPNEDEQILANSGSHVWDVDNPPLKISVQPLPPGIDRTDPLSSTKDISCELASFYSDLATLEPPIPATTNASGVENKDSTTEKPDKIKKRSTTQDDNSEKKRRKKIRVQGLGSKMKEVSTMVANWQKAQKELGS